MIEYSRDAPFSPNAVVTIRTLGQEKRQFLISDMMRMSVAQHRQTYKVGCVRLVAGCWPVSRLLQGQTGPPNVPGGPCQTCGLGTVWMPAVAAAFQGVCLRLPLGERFLLGTQSARRSPAPADLQGGLAPTTLLGCWIRCVTYRHASSCSCLLSL